MTRRLLLTLSLICLLTVNAQAAPIQVIVKLGPLVNLSLITNLLGGTILDSIPGTNTYLVRLPLLPVVTPLLKLLGLVWIEPNKVMALPSLVPEGLLQVPAGNAPDWYRHQPAMQLIRAGASLPYSTGRGVVVADINSQVDRGHAALIGHLTTGYDLVPAQANKDGFLNDQSSAGFLDDQSSAGFLDDQSSAGFLDQSSAAFLQGMGVGFMNDQSSAGFLDGKNPAYSHGTLCAGIIAAIAPDAMIMPIRAFDNNGNADVFTLAKAIRQATRSGAHVINMSFGTLQDVKVLREAIDDAKRSNVVLVASAGNNNTAVPQFPASYAGVLAVGSTDLFDIKAWFSNYGSNVVVDAPGVWIMSAYPGGTYKVVSGTSFSAPAVAGAAALVRSLRPTGVAAKITATTVKIDSKNPKYAGKLGFGRIDILRAVKP